MKNFIHTPNPNPNPNPSLVPRKKKFSDSTPRKKKFFFEVQKKAEKNNKIFFHNEDIKDGQKFFCL